MTEEPMARADTLASVSYTHLDVYKRQHQIRGIFLKGYHIQKTPIEERAVAIAEYIVKNKATVRQAAGQFGVSKSTCLLYTSRCV